MQVLGCAFKAWPGAGTVITMHAAAEALVNLGLSTSKAAQRATGSMINIECILII